MNCEKVKDIILTDYLDGQLDIAGKAAVESHLGECPDCKEFAFIAGKASVEPFLKAKDAHLSENFIWSKVKKAIEGELQENAPVPARSLWDVIKENMSTFKPSFVMAAMAVVILAIAVPLSIKSVPQTAKAPATEESGDYIDYVADELVASLEDDNSGYDTGIEEYFL